jgi:hypothetical protein
LLPGVARGVAVAGGVARVPKVLQIRGKAVPDVPLAIKGAGLLEVVDGLVVLTNEVVGVAKMYGRATFGLLRKRVLLCQRPDRNRAETITKYGSDPEPLRRITRPSWRR